MLFPSCTLWKGKAAYLRTAKFRHALTAEQLSNAVLLTDKMTDKALDTLGKYDSVKLRETYTSRLSYMLIAHGSCATAGIASLCVSVEFL